MIKQIIAVLFFIVFSVYVYPQSNQQIPHFQLESIDGEIVDSKDLTKENLLLISFWATWCKPCIEELIYLNIIYMELKDKGLTFVAISTDSEKTISKVKPFIKSKKYDFPVLLDKNSETARNYYINTVPSTILIDKNGKFLYSHSGYKKGDEIKLKAIILENLNK